MARRSIPDHIAPTAENIERGLNDLAQIILAWGEEGAVFLPIYRRLEEELAALRVPDLLMDAVRDRAARSQAQTAERSSPVRRAATRAIRPLHS